MAEQSQNPGGPSAEQLSQTLAQHRAALGKDALLIRENLNLKKKLGLSVHENPRVWMGAAVGTGLFMGVIVPRLAAAIGSALVPKRRAKSRASSGPRGKGSVTPEEQEVQSEKAATKGAAMGTLLGSFGGLIFSIIRPILMNIVREQVETRLLSKMGNSKQKQSQR